MSPFDLRFHFGFRRSGLSRTAAALVAISAFPADRFLHDALRFFLSARDPDSAPAAIKTLLENTNKMALEGTTFNEAFETLAAASANITGNLT